MLFRPIALVLAAALFAPGAARAADPLAEALQGKAPAVIEAAKKKGFRNLGVLKFLVRHGADGPPKDDIGDLNLSLANKAEVALILANTDETFGIIDKASEFVVREKMTSANHLTADGRKAFFTRKYELAWSRDKVEPSGFLTGTATLSDDLKQMTVRLQVFDKTGAVEELPGEILTPADPELLAQAGFSYAVSPVRVKALIAGNPPPAREVQQTEAIEGMLKVSGPAPEPAKPEPFAPLATSPVKWAVLYNNKAVPVTGNTVPEPGMNEKVTFTLTNPGPGTYAVVLMVNGENTLYQERDTPAVCRKWVLPPGSEVTVRGFQTAQNTTVPFKVLSPEDAEPDVMRYGDHAGTYRLVVYHGKTTTTDPAKDAVVELNEKDAAALAVARTRGTTRPEGVKPQSLKALQADLRGRAKAADGARGFVVKGGDAERFETNTVYFAPSSDLPVADITLRYFTPKK